MARWIGQYQYSYTERELQPGEWYMPEDMQQEYVPTEVNASNYWDATRKSEKQANARRIYGEDEHPQQNYLVSYRDIQKAERARARGAEDLGGTQWRWFFEDTASPWARTIRSHYARDRKEQETVRRHRAQRKKEQETFGRGKPPRADEFAPDIETRGKKGHRWWREL